LEQHYITEYGLPSTHSMAAISMPMYILFLAPAGHFYPLLPIALAWFVLMTLSRVYLGVHSLPDIYVGLVFGFMILCFHCAFGTALDTFLVSSSWAPVAIFSFAMFLIAIYPAPEKWTTAFGDTVLIIGVAVGVTMANWTHFYGLGYAHPELTFQWVGMAYLLARLVSGVLVLVVVRTAVKKGMLIVLKYLIGYQNVNDALRTYTIEIPTKFMTYGSIGFSCVFLMPRVFGVMSI
jgi:hypothetical protein